MQRSTFKSQCPKISSSNSEEPSLPNDLWIEILKRLPLKYLVRLTCVCKSWLSLLKSSTFLSTLATFNLRNSRVPQKSLLFKQTIDVHNPNAFTNFPVFTYKTVFLSKDTEFACEVGRNHFVVGSADGLVCLFEFYCQNPENAPLILWNPSLRKAQTVPFPVHADGVLEFTLGGFPKLIFGFGFDLCSNSYKAVRVAYYNGRGGESKGTIFRGFVYCVDDCEWRDLGRILMPQYILTIRWRGVYLNGIIHWICNVSANLDANSPIQRSLLTLNLGNGVFGEIKLTGELVAAACQTLKVVMVPRGGKEVLGVINKVGNVFSLWVMEEYGVEDSWVELFSVDFKDEIKNDTNVAVLSDQCVVLQLSSGWWVSYDHTRKHVHHLRWDSLEGVYYVDAYVESLILLGQRNGALPAKEVQQEVRKSCRGRRRRATAK